MRQKADGTPNSDTSMLRKERLSVRDARRTLAAAALALLLPGCDVFTDQGSCDEPSEEWTYRCSGDQIERCTYVAASDSYIWLPETYCKDFRDGQYHCEEDAGDACETVPHDACCVRNAPAG